MTVKKQFIIHDPQDRDAWICVCGNRPIDQGFYPCDANGNELDPVKGSGWSGLHVCDGCGRVIDQKTLKVVGRKPRSSQRGMKVDPLRPITVEMLGAHPRLGREKWHTFIRS